MPEAESIRSPSVRIRACVPGPVTASVQTTVNRTSVDGASRPRSIVEATIDATKNRGSLSRADGDTLAEAARLARERKLPFVLSVASSGADVDEGVDALHGWGQAARAIVACSGVVPIIFVVTGPTTAGPALLLGLADLVVFTESAYAFVSGPQMVANFTGVAVTAESLGGAASHRNSGLASLVVADEVEADEVVADLLTFLPDHADQLPPQYQSVDLADRLTPELSTVLPVASTGSYDVRTVADAIVDTDSLLELRSGFAANLVTALALVDGRPVGVVANQPQTVAGTLDIAASQKGARFVAMCDAFSLPLLTLVDTSGFYPGKDLEWRGMIRYGAQLAFAYARATVPRVQVTLRKSYGGAYIVMDSKNMGNDIALAWPSAEIAVMGAKGAVEILHRRASPDERAELERDYEARLLNPYAAAERGSVDAVIDPADTRREVVAAFAMLSSKREKLAGRRHDNTPL